MPSFIEQLPTLLRLMADPATPHTTKELWCRITADGWDRHVPTLLNELQTGDNDVKRLVLSICEQAFTIRTTPLQPFLAEIERLLTDEDGLVRISAISTVRRLAEIGREEDISPSILQLLRRLGCDNEVRLAREAMLALLESDDGAVREVASIMRDR
jgi:hypothetical protein